MAIRKTAANGKNGSQASKERPQDLGSLDVKGKSGRVYKRKLDTFSVPFWQPQSDESGHPHEIEGTVMALVTIPAHGKIKAQPAFILRTEDAAWKVPVNASLARQVGEGDAQDPANFEWSIGEGQVCLVKYEGTVKVGKRSQPMNRFSFGVAE